MKASAECLRLIREFESLELEAYLCPAGIPTIGYGHTLGVQLGTRITADQAEAFLRDDVAEAERALEQHVHVPVSQGQWDALVSFAFNVLGWRSSTLLKKVNERDFEGAAAEFGKWVRGGGKVLGGLVRRRAAEVALFRA